MSARVALLWMERDGLIVLPQRRSARVLRPIPASLETEPPLSPTPERQVRPLEPIRNAVESRLWNAFRYLGFTPMPGAQLRHFFRPAGGEPLAMLGFGALAWKIRDSGAESRHPALRRQQRKVPCPESNILLPSHRSSDVHSTNGTAATPSYCLRPSSPRFAGTCYRAANWIRVGKTRGRGELDVKNALPVNWLKPLRRDWKKVLDRKPSPRVANAYVAFQRIATLPQHNRIDEPRTFPERRLTHRHRPNARETAPFSS